MHKGLLIGIAIIVVLAAGIGIYSSNSAKNDAVMMDKQKMEQAAMEKEKMEKEAMEKEQKMKDEAMKKEDSMMQKDEGAMMDKSSEGAMMKSGSYEPYASAKVAMASASHDVVLFFRASWCPTCRAVDADIKAHLKDIPASLSILDVDYDNSTDLKKKYGVTYQHTFVQVDAQGNMIKKWSGSPTLSAIVAEVK